ncbi:MAG: precorrin-3B synthase, partial [Rhizobiaceae bacterium]
MNAISRRGACPALSAPMRTGDGLLVRLNPVASGFSPNTLIGLCESASRHGNGLVEVTARGSLQIRGLSEASAPLLAAEVDALGIEVRTGVPVETGPLAGLDPDETADPRPLAETIRERIGASGLSPRLGPKVSVVVDGGGRFGMSKVAADLRLDAVDAGMWRVAVAGDAETAQVRGVHDADAARDIALSVLEAIAALGIDGRARDLPAAPRPSGRPEVGNVEHRSCKTAQTGFHALRDSRVALAVALPFGQMRAESVIAFARAAEERNARDIRLAPGRMLLVPCTDRPAAEAFRAMAENIGFVTDPADPRLSIAACPGSPACGSGKIPARDLAATIARDHAALFDGSFELHVSGCAKGCAHPAPAALTLVGADRGCGLVLGCTAR